MKKIEWLIAGLLIIVGLTCLTVSGTTMWEPESVQSYLKTLIQLCLWMGLPVVIIGIIYVVVLKRNK
ncbi:hypothetical protein [Virgibacillus sp. DJP39]|uniref:hypothetical protein n=1 Tax=Virgibacillus sp. DJP39 TaxID=3409790 RepID=UPI003BB7148D